MNTKGGDVFIAICSECGTKISATGQIIEGDRSPCNGAHKYAAPNTIVYPTDAERAWLRILDQNKSENKVHVEQFDKDIDELNQFKAIGVKEIAKQIKILKDNLDERCQKLEDELIDAFEQRQSKMYENLKSLSDHRKKNEETKVNAEYLLKGDKPESEREKVIVEGCKTVINTTPKLKYVPTELHFSFSSMDRILSLISNFGILHIQRVDGGKPCVFESTFGGNKPAQPIDVKLPSITLRLATYDKKQGAKLKFSVTTSTEDEQIMNNLSIQITGSYLNNDGDDIDEKNDEFHDKMYDQTIPLSNCNKIDKRNYETFITREFEPGTIGFKIRAIFKSPDESKFNNGEGKWSKMQHTSVPENTYDFNLELNGITKTYKLSMDDPVISNFMDFQHQFLSQFNKDELGPNETLELKACNGDTESILNEKHNLTNYASPTYTIRGRIIVEQPGRGGPKQIGFVVKFGDSKKRIILRNTPKKDLYEYKMEILAEKVRQKFSNKGLKDGFGLKLENGQTVENDDDILDHLVDIDSEVEVFNK